MEFFAEAAVRTTPEALQAIDIPDLPRLCASIDSVLEHAGEHGVIDCLWGRFEVRREPIRGGVRFTLPGCPNALAWTLTTAHAPAPGQAVIHCTIDRREHAEDFVESIREFIEDWRRGLEAAAG